MPTPRALNVTRLFHCNCTSPGNPVLWAGNVQASSYFQARQMGTSQCLAYIGGKPTFTPDPHAGGRFWCAADLRAIDRKPMHELRLQLTASC